jgi:hypothetical protein
VYSLVSASVLALDLARHPSGAAVADTVDRVLCLTPADVRALADAAEATPPAPRDEARTRLLDRCATAPRMSALMRGVRAVVEDGLPDPVGSRLLLAELGATLLGGLADVHALLLREPPLSVQGLPAAGVQAALDVVTVAWAGRAPDVELGELALLRAPWQGALSPVPPALPEDGYGGGAPALRALLEQVSRTGPSAWARVEQAHWERSDGLRWSQAMHQASRAAHESSRLVDVARAQLAAARALRLAGVSTTGRAPGATMAVTAAVQATCLRDVLDADCAAALLAAWEAGTA